jgi:hypothetical protein
MTVKGTAEQQVVLLSVPESVLLQIKYLILEVPAYS